MIKFKVILYTEHALMKTDRGRPSQGHEAIRQSTGRVSHYRVSTWLASDLAEAEEIARKHPGSKLVYLPPETGIPLYLGG